MPSGRLGSKSAIRSVRIRVGINIDVVGSVLAFEVELSANFNLKLSLEETPQTVAPPQTPTKSRRTSSSYSGAQDEFGLKTPEVEAKPSHHQTPTRSSEIQFPPTPLSLDNKYSSGSLPSPGGQVSPLAKKSTRRRSSGNQVGGHCKGRSSGLGLVGVESEPDSEPLGQASPQSQPGAFNPSSLPAPHVTSRSALPPLRTDLFPGSRLNVDSSRPLHDPFIEHASEPQFPGAYPVSPSKRTLDEPAGSSVVGAPLADTDCVSTNSTRSNQCSVVTNNGRGHQCTNSGTSHLPLLHQAPETQVDYTCTTHIKVILKQISGFYFPGKPDVWVRFAEWIPKHLLKSTQLYLRREMVKYVSDSDEAGYIYAFEIRNPKTPDEFHIKVGRSINPGKRLDDWRKQCPSSEPVLRGWWPGNIEGGNTISSSSLLTGGFEPGEMGKYCHRLERLIHLELSDIALSSVHLTSDFEAKILPREGITDESFPSNKVSSPPKLEKKPCSDCGKKHQEIFTFKRITSGEMEGREWECVIMPIIERWGRFVSEYASKEA